MRNNMEKSTEPAKLKENGDKKNTKQQGKCRSISYPSTCLCEYFGRNKYHEPMTCQKVLDWFRRNDEYIMGKTFKRRDGNRRF